MPKVSKQTPNGVVRGTVQAEGVLGRIAPLGFAEDEGLKVLLYGTSGCLAGDTWLNYCVKDTEGKNQNSKGGTIETLYKRFNNLPRQGKGYYQRPQTVGAVFTLPSVDDDGRVFHNFVRGVVDSGIKTTYRVVTERGNILKATLDHQFLTPNGYLPLSTLVVGDTVFMNPKKRKGNGKQKRPTRPEIFVKNHPTATLKMVAGYTYYRIPLHRAVYEAHQNGMTLEQYREVLNLGANLHWVIPPDGEIHHLDENPFNNSLRNLVLTTSSSEHQKQYHANELVERCSIRIEEDYIVEIHEVGKEPTYDVVMDDPHRNFVAGNFVVHNSGKTTLAATFPGPTLWILCSGGKRPGELRSVNTAENRKKINQVVLQESGELLELVAHVAEGGKYATVIMDHVSGLQDLVLKELLGLDELPAQKTWGLASQQQYGQLALQCKEYLRALLNLKGNVVLVGQERTFGGKEDGGDPELIKPTVGVALTPSLTGWLNPAVDYILQCYKRPRMKEVKTEVNGKVVTTVQRGKGAEFCARTEPHEIFTTKFRMPRGKPLPECIVDPSYDKIAALIRGE